MPLEEDTTTTYIYVKNNDPTNTSIAFTFNGETTNLGDEIDLTEAEHAQLSPYFVLTPSGEVVEEEVVVGEAAVAEAAARDEAEEKADDPVTGLTQSPWTQQTPATSGPGDNLGESQNASGSS